MPHSRSSSQPWRSPAGLRRSRRNRVLGGVCGGVGEHLGVDPVVVRLAFVVLSVVSGTGVLLYVLAMFFIPEAPDVDDDAPQVREARPHRSREVAVAFGFLTVGALLLLRSLGLWFPDQLVWPVAIAAIGLGLVWARTDDGDGDNGEASDDPEGVLEAALTGSTPMRLVVGTALLLAGLGTFAATNRGLATLGYVGMAVVVTAAGAALLAGPWMLRLWRQLLEERSERIRSDERADMAAHLHDSVLQTLALIQRRASSPQETVALARRQERELRAWLYGERRWAGEDTLATALEAVAGAVEADHAVTVEVITAGDCPLDDRLAAVAEATREAVVNAAKHAGVDEISVFLEVEPDRVTVFVRDRGVGFDTTTVDGDRRGIADSIVGRMQRHGGTATLTSAPGEGTEVVLELRRVSR